MPDTDILETWKIPWEGAFIGPQPTCFPVWQERVLMGWGWAGAIGAALGVALEGSLCQGTLCSSSGACSEFLALGWCPSSPLRQQQELLLLFSMCFGFVPVPLAHAKAFCSCKKAGHFYFFLKKRCPGSQPLTRAVADFGGMHGTQQVHFAFWRSPLGWVVFKTCLNGV